MINARTIWLAATLVMIASATPAIAAQVVVRKLDGSQVAGHLRAISSERLELANPSPEAASDALIDLRQAMTVEFPRKQSTAEPSPPSVVVLADGSRLPFEQIEVDKHQAQIRLPPRIIDASASEWTVAAPSIQAIRFGRGTRHVGEWNRLAASVESTDLIVVYRKQGAAIDAVECVVEQVSAKAVRVLLDGEPLDVPRAKVFGVAFAQLDQPEPPAETIIVEATDGLRIAATQISLTKPDTLRVITPSEQTFALPVEKIERIDLSAGRVRWLGDLKLVEQAWRPRFGFPAGLPTTARPQGLLFDRSFAGEPLRIAGAGNRGSSSNVTEFARGVAMRGGSEAVFAVPDGFRWFYAMAGIDPRTLIEGAVVLRLYTDDRQASEHTIDGSSPVEIRMPIDGASRLRVVVGYGENLDLGDRLHLGDARVTR